MTLVSAICCCCCRGDDSGQAPSTQPQQLKKHAPQIIIQEPTPMVVRKPSDVEKVLIGTSEEEIVPVTPETSVVPSVQKATLEDAGEETDGVAVETQKPENKVAEVAEEVVEEVGQEVSVGDGKEEDGGGNKKENFSKNPSNNNNNNNNVKKGFNRESAKRKISIPLHIKSMEQEKVVEPSPVMELIEVEDDASRKSSVSTQWSFSESDNEERQAPIIQALKKTTSAPGAIGPGGLLVEPGRSVRVSTVVPPSVNHPNAEKRGKFTKIPHKDL